MDYFKFVKNLKSCPFCKFKKEWILKENKFAILALARAPDIKDHLLVFPKRHITKLCEMKLVEIILFGKLFYSGYLKLKRKYSNISILYREGKKSGKSVDHLHIQLIPNTFVSVNPRRKRLVYSKERMSGETKDARKKFS